MIVTYDILFVYLFLLLFIYLFNREKELEFVDTQNTTTDYDGWLRFNATGALVSWTHYLYPNRGLYVSVHSHDNEGNIYYKLAK